MFYAGVDEVGLGALAGPMVAVAIAMEIDLPPNRLHEFWPISSVKDSKKTTQIQRESLRTILTSYLIDSYAAVGVSVIPVEVINEKGFSFARKKLVSDAVRNALEPEGLHPHQLVVDGDLPVANYQGEQRVESKADGRYWIVAAASILAKIIRDDMMVELGVSMPQYGFATHKGYGTKAHVDALRQYGQTPHHRELPCETLLKKRRMESLHRRVFGK